ncbi:ankyrin [Lentithecium fluviatile CBS 122367]|uniref:Ankyrin n=1 Tax=Lentithecium fluviatile CBS 122367 TaxID=1168545 RepID=A0A6G1J468_9PLEO|nr:ankyrin [Lentithecium fluviatile CBS 122367]
MSPVALDEDSIDEILYLARANEVSELSAFLSDLSAQTKHPQAELVAAAVDPYTKNTALHYAAANGHNAIIKLLLSLHTDKATASASAAASGLVNAVNDAGNTALHWAGLNGHLESVKSLVQSGADVTIINKAGHDAVFEAEINDKGGVVDWLLGAVEELEKGIGQDGEASVHAGMDLGDGANGNDATGAGEGSAAGVEDVRRQMGELSTKDGTVQVG